MTFGYFFSPCGVKLATGWNGLESNWLKYFLGERLRRNGVKLGNFFQGGCFWLQGSEAFKISGSCHQVVVGFLAFANSWKENPQQVRTWEPFAESRRLLNKTIQLITSDHNAQWLMNHWSKFNTTNQ
jgi:hypothetical protein